jgi:hypothetical protein
LKIIFRISLFYYYIMCICFPLNDEILTINYSKKRQKHFLRLVSNDS